MKRFKRTWPAALAVVSVSALCVSGCNHSAPDDIEAGSQVLTEISGDQLFDDVAQKINRLDEGIKTELHPPRIIVDASSSQDGGDVMATITGDREGRNRLLTATTKNSRFVTLSVEPGDRVRYYVFPEDPADDLYNMNRMLGERRSAIEEQGYVEMIVLQVLNEHQVLLAGEVGIEVTVPFRVEVWRYVDDRVREIVARLTNYIINGSGVLAWQPTPDEEALDQLMRQLNTWVRSFEPSMEWQAPELIETLPDEYEQQVDVNRLASLTFDALDARMIQQAVWHRDLSEWVVGAGMDDVETAAVLFDWVVRNIQLETRGSLGGLYNWPWETLLSGRGTAEDRAWVFVELCRQKKIEAVVVGFPDAKSTDAKKKFLVAVFADGDLYLFDPQLGLPIPGPDGAEVATLVEVQFQAELLESLEVEGMRYPLTAEDFNNARLMVAAAPESLSKRMLLVERGLTGEQKVVLTANTDDLAHLWEYPYQTLERKLSRDRDQRRAAVNRFDVFCYEPKLWQARVLHFQHDFSGRNGAKTQYRALRRPDSEIEARLARAPDKRQLAYLREAKQHASYWLGHVLYSEGVYDAAADYFRVRTLEASPDGPFSHSARYNLARTYEQIGDLDEAIALYEASESPQRHGDLIRARRLKRDAAAE